MSEAGRVRLLGHDFWDINLAEAVSAICRRSSDLPFAVVVTPNADHVVRLSRYPDLRPHYDAAWMTLLDSRVICFLGRAFGLRVPQVVTGADLTKEVLEQGSLQNDAVTIIGMAPEHVLQLQRMYALKTVFHHNPPMGFEHDEIAFREAVDFACAHPARIVFLAVGSPRQEKLATAIREAGGTGIGLCIGAALEFMAGSLKRAPRWMQGAGMEWLYRLCSEPHRMVRRYLRDDPEIIALLIRERISAIREGGRVSRG